MGKQMDSLRSPLISGDPKPSSFTEPKGKNGVLKLSINESAIKTYIVTTSHCLTCARDASTRRARADQASRSGKRQPGVKSSGAHVLGDRAMKGQSTAHAKGARKGKSFVLRQAMWRGCPEPIVAPEVGDWYPLVGAIMMCLNLKSKQIGNA